MESAHKNFLEIKEQAKQFLLASKFIASIGKYISAYEILTTDDVEILDQFKKVPDFNIEENRAIIKTNIGICYMKMKNYVDAVDSFNNAYDIYPVYEKSLYRLAVCYQTIGDFQQAALALQKMRTSIGDAGVQKLLQQVMKQL